LIELGRDLAALCRTLPYSVSDHLKTQFSELRSEASDIIRTEGGDPLSLIGAKTFQRKIVLWLGRRARTPLFEAAGFWLGNLHEKVNHPSWFFPGMNPLPLSKSARVGGWRFSEKWFSGSGFAAAGDARRCSGFVSIAIADNAIAARPAAAKPGAGSTGRPTAAIS